MARGPRVLFRQVSLRRIVGGIRRLRPGMRRGGRRRTIVSVRPGSRVAFRRFKTVRFRIKRVVTYRTMGGSGGLLYSRMGIKDRMGRVMSKVGTRCAPRRVINGGIVILMGLGPTGLTNMLSRKVLLYTRSTRNGLTLVAPRGRVPTKTRVYWLGYLGVRAVVAGTSGGWGVRGGRVGVLAG